MNKIAIILIVTFALLSCGKTVKCSDTPVEIAFISFPLHSIDTLVIKKFVQNSNFQNLIDTINLINANTVVVADTVYINRINSINILQRGFDWQIVVPASNRTFSISNIVYQEEIRNCGTFESCICFNKIISVKVNGQILTINPTPANFVFLR